MTIVVRKRSGRLPGGIHAHVCTSRRSVCVCAHRTRGGSGFRGERHPRDLCSSLYRPISEGSISYTRRQSRSRRRLRLRLYDDDDAARTDLNRKFPCAGSHRSPAAATVSRSRVSYIYTVRARTARPDLHIRSRT
jgi:hypothetical protein